MDIGLLISPADYSADSTSSSALSEKTLPQQSPLIGTFFTLLNAVAQNLSDGQLAPLSHAGDPIEPAPSIDADDHATGSELSSIAVASFFAVRDLPDTASPMADLAESLEDATEDATKIQRQSGESISLIPQGMTVVALPDGRMMRAEPVPVDPSKTDIVDSSIDSLPRPTLDRDRFGEIPVRAEGARASFPAAILEQPSGNATLPTKTPPAPPIADRDPAIPAASVNTMGQSLERLSAGVQSLAMVQEQGTQQTTLTGQSLSAPLPGVSKGGEQNSFGADAQGAGDGAFFRFDESGAPESVTRGNQPQLSNGQFTSVLQEKASPQGESISVATPSADRLKTAQAFLGEDRSATATAASGKAQSIHVELPAHDSGPLSVRISMTDQMVHTQFATDRNDLGALLFARQDQLQQGLAKSGLELGQFQVHIDQRNQQESLPERQSRRNGEAPEQQPDSQDRNQQAHDRERQNHRPPHGLSLFA